MTLKLDVFPIEVRNEGTASATAAALEAAIAVAANRGAEALYPLPDFLFDIRRDELAAAARAMGLPAIYSRAEFAEAGGLIAYGPDTLVSFRRVAGYVHRIVGGADPRHLPVEQPSRFELVLNLAAARALSIEFSGAILSQATHIIN